MAPIKGVRTRHPVTMNPNTASPGEENYARIPKLAQHMCLVSGFLRLLLDFKTANTKTRFLNNLSRQLQSRIQVRIAGEVAYDNTGESDWGTYKDLWLSKSKRNEMVQYGIANENHRKLISKDDSTANSGDTAKVSDGLLFFVYGTKQMIPLSKVIEDQGLYQPSQYE